ncbi:uncharacterized protein LOC119611809 isoform X3 [Lucilia sericata]|uniref:uncharacterized protein LOC119611809 isoform X3 n=1 Tax=Lucilia sericata TaxID=13632 RepID=UPI0018A8026C|nr:uncharacterized protein LOC119611809 isoform X3 [Lucilia sericata]
MKLSVSAYRAHASAHKKILSSGYHSQLNYGSTGAAATASSSSSAGLYAIETNESSITFPQEMNKAECNNSDTDVISPTGTSSSGQDQIHPVSKRRTQRKDDDQISNAHSSHSDSKSPSQRKSRIGDGTSDPDSDWTRSNQRWMKLRTTVQISSAIQKKPPLKREDSFLKRFSTRQIPETQETVEDTGSESASGDVDKTIKRRRRYLQKRRSVVNPDENFYFYWLMVLTICVLYNLWTLIVRQSFPELQNAVPTFWFICDTLTDIVFIFDIFVQLRTGYLEQGLMVYDDKKLMSHYVHSRDCFLDIIALVPFDLLQLKMGSQPLLRFTRFFKVYRSVRFYYIVESRTVWPNLWRVVNLIHILLILAHWFGCFYYLLSEAEGFQGDWVYPYRPGDYATLTRKYLGSLYWSTLTLTTIGDLPTPETNAEINFSVDGPRSIPRRGIKSRLLQFGSNYGYIFTIVSYLIGVFIFATIVGQVGNVITNRNANRLEFERLLDGAKTYMRHHKVPGGMKRRVLRWYDYSWSRGRIQGGGDINTALGLLPDKLKTELALHVNLSVLKKVTIFQECQPEFLHDLVLKMKAYIFTPGDSICRKGEVAREMFIIADGILEVLSETGKVLTTMKAGDFFGEIGILNLDGLNKRTADVRSVGYSELFSLSREDVLAAMKDYPEAQEILQTLGRKRLMEVRCVNKKYAKAQADKEAENHQGAHHHHSHVNQSDSSENSASKKIVDKLRHDVKGFRSVLKKSRTTRRSDESLEMQPLHSTSPKNGKSMLKRMSRVRSDDKEETAEEKEELHDKSPSPIGAGLPLLQRLRLLKEKQESIQEEPEREINEGLPLIQRLQQLKIKNDPPHPVNDSSLPISSITSEVNNKLENISNISSNNNSNTTPISLAVTQIKPTMKVSFRQRIQQLQQQVPDNESTSTSKTIAKVKESMSEKSTPATSVNVKKEPPKTLSVVKCGQIEEEAGVDCKSEGSNNKSHKPTTTIPNQIVKPSTTTTPTVVSDTDTPIKPWSKLKLATLISSSYTSLATSNTSSDDVSSPLKMYSMGSIPQQVISEEKRSKKGKPIILPAGKSSALDQTESSSSSTKQCVTEKAKKSLKSGKALQNAVANQTKLYQSVFDLSPEYSGLPFVKRLKILNERQKLAELEKALQTRSFSLDSSKTNSAQISEALYRCHSDATGINSQFFSAYESSSTTSTNTSTSEKSKCPHYHRHHRLDTVHHDYTPLSPESNETLERRKLKSILKKISHEREHKGTTGEIQTQINCGGLSMEPTVEGPPGSVVITNPENTKDEHQNDNSLNSPTTTNAPPFYAESVMSPPDLLRAESIATCCTTANCSQTFQMNSSSSTLTMFPTDLYPHSGTSHGACHVPNIKGSLEGQDCYNQILNGINNVIRTHINEIHSKFETQFSSMAMEVERRDALIAHLQSKLRTLELHVASAGRRKANREKMTSQCADGGTVEDPNIEDNSSSGSSAELLFMRGDSLDTVFTSSPPTQAKRHCTCSPKTSRDDFAASNYSHYCKTGNGTKSKNGNNWSTNQPVVLADVQGNLSRIGDSVILDIGESTSSSSSSDKLNVDDDDEDDDNESSDNHVHHNDWEVRMLAAEMEKQERKRGLSLSDNLQMGCTKLSGTYLRRRRKFSDTETECSETDAEQAPATVRPRASSLDQFNLRYGIGRGGIFKAMSIDRDKDKL